MEEENETPPGRLADYLIGDLGVARRHLQRLLNVEILPTKGVLLDIVKSIECCVERIERDVRTRNL